MTTVWVTGVVSVLLSLALDLIPGLSDKWEKLSPEAQKWVWLLGCMVVPLAVVGLSCVGVQFFAVTCTADALASALAIGAAAYVPSQVSHFAVEAIASRRA